MSEQERLWSETSGDRMRVRPEDPRPARILVVEDEPDVRDLVLEILREEKYDVDGATNGVEALDLLGRQPYDVVVSDLHMPKMDGELLYREMRRRLPVPPPVVFVTGESTPSGYAAFLADVDAPVVPKPFRAAAIVGAVQRVLHA